MDQDIETTVEFVDGVSSESSQVELPILSQCIPSTSMFLILQIALEFTRSQFLKIWSKRWKIKDLDSKWKSWSELAGRNAKSVQFRSSSLTGFMESQNWDQMKSIC